MARIIIWIIMLVGGSAVGLYLDGILFESTYINPGVHFISFIIGALLFAIVVKISKNTGRALSRYGRTGNLKRMETNILVNRGAYKYMRHPMHLGLLLFPLSFAFIIGSPSFILFIAPGEIMFILLMIKLVEEPKTIKKFGKDYMEYKSQRPWFCIKKDCLKELLK